MPLLDSHDSCKGDSGSSLHSPIQVSNSIKYVQFGIVSYGDSIVCGDNKPGVYTNVYSHLNWILDNL